MLNFDYKSRPRLGAILGRFQLSTLPDINELEIADENAKNHLEEIKINESSKSLSASPASIPRIPSKHFLITSKKQIVMDRLIFADNGVNININFCKIIWKGNETRAIIKIYKESDGFRRNDKFEEEVAIMEKLSGKHRLFLELYGYFYDKVIENGIKYHCSNVVIEYCPYNFVDDIKSRIKSNTKFTEPELKLIATDLLEAFEIMAVNKIYHQNIKPSNILMTKDKNLKISDIRNLSAKEIIEEDDSAYGMYGQIEVANYLSPELRSAQLNDNPGVEYLPEQANVYSLGLVLYQCATLTNVARFNEDPANIAKVNNVEWPWLREILVGMLCYDYRARISFRAALNQVPRF